MTLRTRRDIFGNVEQFHAVFAEGLMCVGRSG